MLKSLNSFAVAHCISIALPFLFPNILGFIHITLYTLPFGGAESLLFAILVLLVVFALVLSSLEYIFLRSQSVILFLKHRSFHIIGSNATSVCLKSDNLDYAINLFDPHLPK